MKAFLTLLHRELSLAVLDGAAIGTALGFYLIVVAFLPLGLGPDLNLLARLAAGLLWIALLLAALISLSRLFAADYEDGTLELLALGPLPLEAVVTAKILAHWISTGILLALASPILGLLLNFPIALAPELAGTLLIGAVAASAIGAIGAALTLQARGGALLVALIVLPLYIPTLIFGISTMTALSSPFGGATAPALILTAISLASLVLAPVAAAAALRAQLG